MLPRKEPDKTIAWNKLKEHYKEIKDKKMINFFNEDKNRFSKFSKNFDNLLIDYSKNLINDKTMRLLLNLADEVELKKAINEIFKGSPINETENRPVLHTSLRESYLNKKIKNKVSKKINESLNKIKEFTKNIHNKKHRGYKGDPIEYIINVGIGGSDLGPKMVCEALKKYKKKGINVFFVSNIDSKNINEVLNKIIPEKSLFIISSKSFTTIETLINANSAKKWFLKLTNNKGDLKQHFVGVTLNQNLAKKFGIRKNYIFPYWNWVGGRYSLWSSVGLSISLFIGFKNFKNLLLGANKMDNHLYKTPFKDNIPIILALIGVWYNNFFNASTHAIFPYNEYLSLLPNYLQQVDMESNGKSVSRNNKNLTYQTGPIIWGGIGTNSQHSFFQLIHQGTKLIPSDFIGVVESLKLQDERYNVLMSNFIGQSQALMKGKNEEMIKNELERKGESKIEIEKLIKVKSFKGNKPSNTIILKKLNPDSLGSLIALYEHKIFIQGIIWNIYSFDQWGVELGKEVSKNLLNQLQEKINYKKNDSSTNGLLEYLNRNSKS